MVQFRQEIYMATPKMSTYLLAFCVGDFEFVSAQTKSGVLARIFACPGPAVVRSGGWIIMGFEDNVNPGSINPSAV